MQALFPLVLVLGVGGLMVCLFAWSLYFQPKWDGERWARAARALGLALEPRTGAHDIGLFSSGPTIKQQMIGERGGVPVRVGVRIVVTSGGKNRQTTYYTYVEAAFPRSLEIGLNAAPSSWLAGAFEALVGVADLQVGHPALDAAYRIQGGIADQTAALLATPYVADPLVALASARFRPYLSDHTVKLETNTKRFDVAELSRTLDTAVELVHRIVSARMAIGPSALQRTLAQAWRPIAEELGLTLDLERYTMSGRCAGMHVEVCTTQSGASYATTFTVAFDRALGLGLKLERQGALSKLGSMLGMQDIQTGDRTFDERFIVKGNPEDAVRAALTAEVRQRLVTLQEQASMLEVEDRYLRAHVGWLVGETAWLRAGITTIAAAGAALTGMSTHASGPYRR